MNERRNISQIELRELSITDYFKTVESSITKNMNVDEVTNFFTNFPYSETNPFLTRRQLNPIDNRFERIELVYSDIDKVKAIVWEFRIKLSMLIETFGEFIFQNEPYSNSTAFLFKSQNQNIAVIKTRHPKWLSKTSNKMVFEYLDENEKCIQINNPEFEFIQISINE